MFVIVDFPGIISLITVPTGSLNGVGTKNRNKVENELLVVDNWTQSYSF